ncbi:MAG TPA: 2-octaprenyl-6-methoxyphenol 4-monooxygenase, partial [Synechococcus sp. UBA9887]|nr:2-octaprenyl-6-methoxyphenol 4-monooxygenase [Synechococcus sp. UBA9887]
MATSSTTVHILGAGPTGSLAAIALASTGCSVVLTDPLTRKELLSRSRAYAITHSSRRLLTDLKLWTPLQSSLTAFSSLDLRDSACGGRVIFGLDDLPNSNARHQAIGWILD